MLHGQFPYLPWRVCCLITCLIENKTVVSVSEGFYQMINYSWGFVCCSFAEKCFYRLILVSCLWVYTVMHVFMRCYVKRNRSVHLVCVLPADVTITLHKSLQREDSYGAWSLLKDLLTLILVLLTWAMSTMGYREVFS